MAKSMRKTIVRKATLKTMKTVRRAGRKTDNRRRKRKSSNREMSSTMQLPLEAIFEDISTESASHLDVHCPGHNPFRIPLNKTEISVGRDADCRIHLPLSNVSRKHARIFCNGEDYVIDDLDSTNGTYVNNVRISSCVLRNNDLVRIGEAKILFVQQKI